MTAARRYAPELAFPDYAYLPGRDPHPTGDPRGHSFGRREPPASHLPPALWRENLPYLYGCDLYNAGYLWEAHEAWEGLWHASKRDPVQADFLQGLIQCAAACLKIPMGQPRGVEHLSRRALERLERVVRSGGSTYMGLDLASFRSDFAAFAAAGPTSHGDRPRIELEIPDPPGA